RGPVAMGELTAISGISPQQLRHLLVALGYRAVAEAGGESFVARPRSRRKRANGRPQLRIDEGHPFAKLRELADSRLMGVLSPKPSSLRLDQWLWYARFAKSRSRAARLCTAGVVTVNGLAVKKAHYAIRVGDIVVVPQGVLARTVFVKA